MASRQTRGRSRTTVILLVLTAILLLTLSGRGFGPLDSVRGALSGALAPVGAAGRWVTTPLTDAWGAVFDQGDLEAQNQRLREENDRLRGQVTESAVATQQLQQLLQLVSIPFVGDTPVVHTRVVTGSVGNFGETIELDKGTAAGITKGMPVITGQGLIGRVAEVSEDHSVVELITGGSFKVGFVVIGTAAVGVASGTGSQSILKGVNIDLQQPVQAGQIAVTAGLRGSTFPPNLPIGTLDDVRADEVGRQFTVDITLFASTKNLAYADVVLWDQGR